MTIVAILTKIAAAANITLRTVQATLQILQLLLLVGVAVFQSITRGRHATI